MENKTQQELIITGLGLSSLALGILFNLFPGFMNDASGFNLEKGPRRNTVIRILGMRDIAFGLGILLRKNDRKEVKLWLNLLAFNAATDGAILTFSLPSSKNKFKTFFGVAFSCLVAFLCLKISLEN